MCVLCVQEITAFVSVRLIQLDLRNECDPLNIRSICSADRQTDTVPFQTIYIHTHTHIYIYIYILMSHVYNDLTLPYGHYIILWSKGNKFLT